MPREGQDFWYLKDVPHGDVQIHSYVSTQNDHIKKCYVYLPPSYRENIDQKYPVMYIQHGVGEDETSWLWNGKLNFIMDNLIAEGKCKGMIVVMCSGYAFRDDEEAVFFPGDFGRELTEDVIPYMEHTFRVKKDGCTAQWRDFPLGRRRQPRSYRDSRICSDIWEYSQGSGMKRQNGFLHSLQSIRCRPFL